jgi:hypothetical protein
MMVKTMVMMMMIDDDNDGRCEATTDESASPHISQPNDDDNKYRGPATTTQPIITRNDKTSPSTNPLFPGI